MGLWPLKFWLSAVPCISFFSFSSFLLHCEIAWYWPFQNKKINLKRKTFSFWWELENLMLLDLGLTIWLFLIIWSSSNSSCNNVSNGSWCFYWSSVAMRSKKAGKVKQIFSALINLYVESKSRNQKFLFKHNLKAYNYCY